MMQGKFRRLQKNDMAQRCKAFQSEVKEMVTTTRGIDDSVNTLSSIGKQFSFQFRLFM